MPHRSARLSVQPLDDRLTPAALTPPTASDTAIAATPALAATALDPTFGPGGEVTIPLAATADGSNATAFAAVPAAGGRTLVLAQRGGTAVVERRLADGQPDTAFGANGRAALPQGLSIGGTEAALAAAPDGGAVVARTVYTSPSPPAGTPAARPTVRVYRLTAAGAADEAFDTAAATATANLSGSVAAVAQAADGRVAVAFRALGAEGRLDLLMLAATGAADEAFGPGGRRDYATDDLGLGPTVTPDPTQPDPTTGLVGTALAFAADGRLLVAGTKATSYQTIFDLVDQQGFVLALRPTGERDAGFGTNGVAADPVGPFLRSTATADRLAVRADGTVLVEGAQGDNGWYVTRLRADGTVDPGYDQAPPGPTEVSPLESPVAAYGSGAVLGWAVRADGTAVLLVCTYASGPYPTFAATPVYSLTVLGPAGNPQDITELTLPGHTPRAVTADAGGGVLVGSDVADGFALGRPAAVAGLTVGQLPGTVPLPPADGYSLTTDGPRLAINHIVGGDAVVPGQPFAPFEAGYTGTLNAVLADLDGDGTPEVVVAPAAGGGPVVAVYRVDGTPVTRFFGIDDPAFRGGARLAAGDLDGDGATDVVVTAGEGGGPRVAVFDGRRVATDRRKLVGDFFAFEPEQRGGANVAVGDVTGDGRADLAFGAGVGGGPRVRVLSGADLLAGRPAVVFDQFVGDAARRDGVRVQVRTSSTAGMVAAAVGTDPAEPFRDVFGSVPGIAVV